MNTGNVVKYSASDFSEVSDVNTLIELIFGRLHDCVFCGLPHTEIITVPPESIEEVLKVLYDKRIYHVCYENRFVLYNTGLQLDKSFGKGQV